MLPTRRLLATATASAGPSSGLRATPLALLPPIPLYRRVLRAHRKHLPTEMRVLGDKYVQKEFRDHRAVENPIHIVGFLTEWQMYAQAIEGDSWKDEKIEQSKIEKMSDQQLGQLYELMQSIQKGENDGGEDKGQA